MIDEIEASEAWAAFIDMRKAKGKSEVEYLRELFSYDADSGVLTWRINKGARGRAGEVVGCQCAKGYLNVQVDGKKMKVHRIAWALHVGEIPSGKIDHKDGNRANNRLCNLRDVTNSVNCQNVRSARKNNKVGVLGVYERKGRFMASIWTKETRSKHLGCYGTADEAHQAYVTAKRELHEGCLI